MERLEIRNFLTIKQAVVDVKKLNVIIGPQATGKSIIAKLLYFFQRFLGSDLIKFIYRFASKREIQKTTLLSFESIFPKQTWNEQDFLITYILNDVQVFIKNERNNKYKFSFKFNYSQNLEELSRKAKILLKKKQQDFQERQLENSTGTPVFQKEIVGFNTILKYISESNAGREFKSNIFIPASRSFFANLQRNVFYFLANNIEIEPFISDFGSKYEQTKNFYELLNNHRIKLSLQDEKLRLKIKELVEKVLSGEYLYENEKDWIYSSTFKRKINLINASSGQQEALPMLLILSVSSFFNSSVSSFINSRFRPIMFFIEEPEAHLFPFSQKYVANLLSLLYNKKQSSFFITTHSPYILTAFNNMIMASNIYKSSGEDIRNKLNKIMDRDIFIDYNDVAAYTIKNGYLESILDEKTQLIGSSIIDSVSDEFSMEFDSLIELQLENYK